MADLLHRLAAGQQLLRQAATHTFIVGTPGSGYTSARLPSAQALINHRLVDNRGPLKRNQPLTSPTLFLINEKGRAWCQENPQQQEPQQERQEQG